MAGGVGRLGHVVAARGGKALGLQRVQGALRRGQREQQREPTVEQIARELGIRREEVVFAMDAVCDPVSLFEPL